MRKRVVERSADTEPVCKNREKVERSRSAGDRDLGEESKGAAEEDECYYRCSRIYCVRMRKNKDSRGDAYSQNDPARLICSQPANTPPTAKPRLVGIRIEPAEAGDQLRTAIA